MKKWIVFILSFYLLFSAIIPCSFFDKCEAQQTQSSNKEQNKNCDNCPPFCICSAAHNFALNKIVTLTPPVIFNNSLLYNEYHNSLQPAYYSSFFQPPRIGQ